ncbi:restriction endonuclease subunit S [Chryseobacterium aquaticum]|uniref:restriction endonuclease subunit S n=1 Tax=Chryseobacterium aquaticum TaxID=452084 RepID=UPI003F71041D
MVKDYGKDGARPISDKEGTFSTMKQTEIGLLPEEWDVNSLKEICKDMIQGINTAIDVPEYSFEGVPILKANNVIDGQIDLNNCEFISVKSFRKYSTRFHISKNDFLLSNIGARLGSGSIYLTDAVSVYAWNVMRLSPKKNIINPHYFSQILNSPYFNKLMINNQSGSGMGFVPKNVLQTFQIPLPPLPEQEAIAEALSDADAWIESLEQLIAKKRLIKQGAMQELLTPKKDWEVKKLGEVGKIYGGLSGKTKQDFGSGNSYYIPFMNVMKNVVTDKNFIEKVNLKQGETQNRVLKNDLLFNGSSETPEELGISSVLLDDIDNLYLNSFCFGFRIFDENVSPIFLSYIMRSPYGREVIFYLAQGATRYNLSKANFFNLEIAFPKSLTEQTRIATILSDMDGELEALEGQLGKARKVKQGMMQELLTGRVRLV